MDRTDFSEWLNNWYAERSATCPVHIGSEGYLIIQHDPAAQITRIALNERAPEFSRWPKELTVTYSLN
jgi:hypothetical protein